MNNIVYFVSDAYQWIKKDDYFENVHTAVYVYAGMNVRICKIIDTATKTSYTGELYAKTCHFITSIGLPSSEESDYYILVDDGSETFEWTDHQVYSPLPEGVMIGGRNSYGNTLYVMRAQHNTNERGVHFHAGYFNPGWSLPILPGDDDLTFVVHGLFQILRCIENTEIYEGKI